MDNKFFNFNNAPDQISWELIPADTLACVTLNLKKDDDGNYERSSSSSDSIFLDADFPVMNGPFKGRHIFQKLFIDGGKRNERNQSISGLITQSFFKAAINSSYGIMPDDQSEAAIQTRNIKSFDELNGLIFAARIGVEPGKNGYKAKNKITQIITPDNEKYTEIMGELLPSTFDGIPF